MAFCAVVPGLPPVTVFSQLSDTRWCAPLGILQDSIVVFLTGTQPLPPGMFLAVFLWKDNNINEYTYIGHLHQERPSAVFKVPAEFMELAEVSVSIGLSLEPAQQMENLGQTEAVQNQSRAMTFIEVARKIADDLQRFVMSHARTLTAPWPLPDGSVVGTETEVIIVPANWVSQWRTKLETKIVKDRLFWAGNN